MVPGICRIEHAATPSGPWSAVQSRFTTNSAGSSASPLSGAQTYTRLYTSDVSGTPKGFTNLVGEYGILETLAGDGMGGMSDFNYWKPEFEGASAKSVTLSRPHHAMADGAGNVFIVDKDSHSVLKVDADGFIHTVAGTHETGFNGNGPALGKSLQLSSPNGLYVKPDGTVYILDTGNGLIRRLSASGWMTTLVDAEGSINGGRGLWVSEDEQLIYFCAGTKLKRWTPGSGVKNLNTSFTDLGNLAMDNAGRLVVTDRGANRVYRVSSGGNLTVIAGDGSMVAAGDGASALATGFWGVRGIAFLPNDGYFLGTHEGSQLWYVDPNGIARLFVDGLKGWHTGDDEYFYSPGYKLSEVRSVSVDGDGNILVVENDVGYVRRIRFLPFSP